MTQANARLAPVDWKILEDIKDVLEVPHLFQQHLSSKKTPTLCWALLAFAAMIQLYNEKLDEHPHLANAIRAGSKKLDEYAEKIREAPAYILAMGIVSPRQTAIHTDNLHNVGNRSTSSSHPALLPSSLTAQTGSSHLSNTSGTSFICPPPPNYTCADDSFVEAPCPARKTRQQPISVNTAPSVPVISSMPSLNASNYTLLSQSRISTPLYPFGMLPSPVTPSTSTTQALSHISNQTPSELNSSTSETSLASLWGFNSDPSPPLPVTISTHPNTEQWMSRSNPNFSHTQPCLRAKKLTFSALYLQQLPPKNSNILLGISEHHQTSLQAFLQATHPQIQISLSSWATQLVGNHVYRSIGNLLCDSPKATSDLALPHIPAHLVASANGWMKAKGLMTVTKEDMMNFCISDRVKLFKYVNGYLAMHMGIWHIACGSHVDVKRAYSHLVTSVHETTARRALEMMGETSIKNLQKEVGAGQQCWQVLHCFVLDNIQEFQKVWEGGLGRENCMIYGTACTAIGLDDCADNAFDFIDWFMHILKNECAKLTTMMLYDSINWTHIQNIQTLFEFEPSLEHMKSTVSELFHSNHAIHCMQDGCKTRVVPFGSNAECEILIPEMAGRDGGSVLAILHAQKLLATVYDPSDPKSNYQILHNLLPTTEWFTKKAECIVDKYMSFDAYKQALSQEINDSVPDSLKFLIGNAWLPSTSSSTSTTTTSNSTDPVPTAHVEQAGFTGDRVLANSILFKLEYSWWIEAAYIIPEGDIGHVWEIMKIWIFVFSGGGNNNYMNILLEMYCLFHYKSSKELKDAIWNNWLVNVTGELGKWITDDLLQEHYNQWLEDMVQKSGGTYDNTFLWKIILPNVKFFLQLKEQIEGALDLFKCLKSHTSPHLRDEFKQLLTMHGNDTLHFFYSRYSMGHAAVSLVNGGFNKLDNGQLQGLLHKNTQCVEIL
ncbi:hypothetical protein BT96DRAFT_1008576 [Gymnopus androsaceus JB14]|uniref:DUF6589 domain-containing protein n=1 Tax=Gymnopus androsaceus JB14 TaxID=1447944 RepID=A0A6A4GEK8_9AGAR|nr:hypothetical protein BT96DRAFT_1008576 [Gymnopus androsaceus JB14]